MLQLHAFVLEKQPTSANRGTILETMLHVLHKHCAGCKKLLVVIFFVSLFQWKFPGETFITNKGADYVEFGADGVMVRYSQCYDHVTLIVTSKLHVNGI